MKKTFSITCPCCGNEADAYTEDARNVVYCSFCNFRSTLIEVLTDNKKNDKLNVFRTINKNYLANQKSHRMS